MGGGTHAAAGGAADGRREALPPASARVGLPAVEGALAVAGGVGVAELQVAEAVVPHGQVGARARPAVVPDARHADVRDGDVVALPDRDGRAAEAAAAFDSWRLSDASCRTSSSTSSRWMNGWVDGKMNGRML